MERLLQYHVACDTSTFQTEDDRHDLATLLLFQAFTGCRPAELVDASKGNACQDPLVDPDDTNDEQSSCDATNQDDYGVAADKVDDGSSDDLPELDWFGEPIRKYKALCYEDICLWIVQNPQRGERDLLAMEVFLRHHKGADNKPKPCVITPCTPSAS